MTVLDRATYRLWTTFAAASALTGTAFAQDGSLRDVPPIGDLPGDAGTTEDLKNMIINIIKIILDFLAIIAVLFIVIAGIRLIVSQGEEEQKEKAKKTIIYVIVGLIVVILARMIVGFIAGTAYSIGE